MTHISFYYGVADRLQAAAQWLVRPGRRTMRIAILAAEREQAALDRLLWESPAIGFLPHCRATHRDANETAVLLADELSAIPHHECVLNLTDGIPAGFERFERMVEIISHHDSDRLPGRQRYRYYRDHGYQIENTDMSRGFSA